MPSFGGKIVSKKTSLGNTFSLNEVKHQNTGFVLSFNRQIYTVFEKYI